MSDILGAGEAAIGSAVSPYLVWIRLAGAAIVVLGLMGAGWWLHGKFDGTAVAKVQAQLATCQSNAETARANFNQAAASGIQTSVQLASEADSKTLTELGQIKITSQHILENVDAQPDGISLGSNPALGAYLDGLRHSAPAEARD